MAEAGTVTRVELCEAVHDAIGLPKAECAKLVDSVLGQICHALAQGDDVKLIGFGTFLLRDKAERLGRNPKSGGTVAIAPRRVMSFRASQAMHAAIAAGQ